MPQRSWKRSDVAASNVFGFVAVLYVGLFVYFFFPSIIRTPFGDMLEWVRGFYVGADDGFFYYLWDQHNEHRLVFAKLLVIADVVAFRGAIYPVAFFNVGLLFVIAATIVRYIVKTVEDRRLRWWVVSAIALLLFPTSSLVNYAYPKNSQVVLVCFFVFWSVVCLVMSSGARSSKSVLLLLLAIGSAAGAGLSSINGLAVWLALLWAAWKSEAKPYVIAVVTVAAMVMIGTYAAGFERIPLYPITAGEFVTIVQFLAEFYGMPWVAVPRLYWPGLLVGAAVFVVTTIVIARKSMSRKPPSAIDLVAVPMLLFVGMTSVLAAIGRYQLDLLPAHRYGLYTIATYVSLFLIAFPYFHARWQSARRRSAMLWGSCVVAVALCAQQIATGRFAADRAEHFSELERKIMAGSRDPEVTFPIFPDQVRLEEHYRIMKEHRIYMYSDTP